MIAKLRGIVDSVAEGSMVIDVGGVGYLVACSSRTLSRLGGVGQPAQLWVETIMREDAILLFGFSEPHERDWFRLLLGVQGVGGKVALALLSVLSPDDLAGAIAAGDKGSLGRASGVGPKLAARLVTELKDRAAALAPPMQALAATLAGDGGVLGDAVSALVNLGYRPTEAAAAVARARAELGENTPAPALIRAGLRELGKQG